MKNRWKEIRNDEQKKHILIILLAVTVVSIAFVALPTHIPNGNGPIPPVWPPVWIF